MVREPAKVFELFLKGDLDWHGLALPEYWYEKLPDDHELVKNGHVEKIHFQRCTPADLGGAVEFKSSGFIESGYSGGYELCPKLFCRHRKMFP